MNIEQIKKWIGTGNFQDAENAWMNAIEDSPAPDKVWQVLESLVAADKAEMAETLGWAMLDAHADAPKDQTLALARAALLAVPESQELRSQTVELYKAVHGPDGNFDKLWKSAGLDGGQSPKRAIRTLDTCLAIQPDKYMANRFDGRVIQITQLNALGEFEFTDAGQSESLEPKLLADEFDLLPETDFRVLSRKDPDALAEMFKKQLDKVLIGLCESHGGSVDTDQIKKVILGKFVPKDKWTSWWGRARTAVKKCGNLVLEGRNPVTVVYHPGGQSLEEELAEQLEEAYSPKEYLGVLRNYMREVAHRGLTADAEFTRPIMNALAARAVQWAQSRPGDALEAVGAIAIGEKLGAAPPEKEYPTASAVLAKADKPAETIADLDDAALWPIAMAALAERDDAAERFGELFSLAPAGQLDTIAAKLA
ncbi:MAG: hypothetical protein K8S55_01855, partial [Phycisphaerae bacterium]|nr:hypothetical protein [Phycisphaerae bacterium]